MTQGVAYVWNDFYLGCFTDTPTGGLFNKRKNLLMFFERYKKSEYMNIKVYTHLFYANELGEPAKLKNSRLHSFECACETWDELVSGGWQIVTSKFR